MTEPEASPPWKALLACPTGTRRRRLYARHLSLGALVKIVGTVKAASLLATYSQSRLPSAKTLGVQLRREALLRHWQSERWHHRRFLERLAQVYDLTPERVRRILGAKYLSPRVASHWRKRGELAERQEAAGVRKITGRLSVKVLR